MNIPHFNIAAVERDTGLSKDVLRVWERRYGFPMPSRDANGERLYTSAQVDRLRRIKRLMDHGHRPGKLMGTADAELALLARQIRDSTTESVADADADALATLLTAIRKHDAVAYQQAMQQRLARQGLQRFVQDTVAPLVRQVGEAWEEGRFEIFEEHLFTELTQRLLRHAIAALPAAERRPRLLLTSVPDEQHSMGLLMVEALLALEGAECIPLGTQTPLTEISRAALAYRAEIIGLSFSTAFPQRQIAPLVQQLRQLLPAEIELWIGGGGISRLQALPGVRLLVTLDDALAALSHWRSRHPPAEKT